MFERTSPGKNEAGTNTRLTTFPCHLATARESRPAECMAQSCTKPHRRDHNTHTAQPMFVSLLSTVRVMALGCFPEEQWAGLFAGLLGKRPLGSSPGSGPVRGPPLRSGKLSKGPGQIGTAHSRVLTAKNLTAYCERRTATDPASPS